MYMSLWSVWDLLFLVTKLMRAQFGGTGRAGRRQRSRHGGRRLERWGGGEMAVRKNKGWLGVGRRPDRAADRCDILPDCRDSLQKRHPVERLLKRQTYVLQRWFIVFYKIQYETMAPQWHNTPTNVHFQAYTASTAWLYSSLVPWCKFLQGNGLLFADLNMRRDCDDTWCGEHSLNRDTISFGLELHQWGHIWGHWVVWQKLVNLRHRTSIKDNRFTDFHIWP